MNISGMPNVSMVGLPVSARPLALLFEPDGDDREKLKAWADALGYDSGDVVPAQIERDMTGWLAKGVQVFVLSRSVSGDVVREAVNHLLEFFPFVPIIEKDVGDSFENAAHGNVVLGELACPLDEADCRCAFLRCQSFFLAFHDCVERELFLQQNRYLEEPMARLIHDLNNQITGLKGGIDLMNYGVQTMQEMETKKKFSRYLEQFILPSLSQIEELVQNWRQRRDTRLNPPSPVAVRQVVREALRLSIALPFHSVFGLEESGESLPLWSESDEGGGIEAMVNMEQVVPGLGYILQNALEAVQDVPDGKVLVRVSAQSEERVALEVHDNGPGVSEDVQPQMWRSFFTTKGDDRNGFGLAVAKQVVDKHQGQIEYFDSPLGGAGIRILLPTSQPSELR